MSALKQRHIFLNFYPHYQVLQNKINPFDFIPVTIILKNDKDQIDKNFNNFKLLFNNIENHLDNPNKQSNKYSDYFQIVKNLL